MEVLTTKNLRGACTPARKAFKTLLDKDKELKLTPARADKAIDALLALPYGVVFDNSTVSPACVYDWAEWLGYKRLKNEYRRNFRNKASELRRSTFTWLSEDPRWTENAKKLARVFIKEYAAQRKAA